MHKKTISLTWASILLHLLNSQRVVLTFIYANVGFHAVVHWISCNATINMFFLKNLLLAYSSSKVRPPHPSLDRTCRVAAAKMTYWISVSISKGCPLLYSCARFGTRKDPPGKFLLQHLVKCESAHLRRHLLNALIRPLCHDYALYMWEDEKVLQSGPKATLIGHRLIGLRCQL